MAKSRRFNVRLLKKGKTLNDAYKDALTSIFSDNVYGVYLIPENKHAPWWKDYLEIPDNILNKSNSAILTVNTDERTLVYTFGFAHTKLNQDFFEEKFGFLVTINSIDSTKLKSIDAYSPANNTKQKRFVSSTLSNIYEYDFNDSQDLIQKLSGVIKDDYKDWFRNPTGSDSLSINLKSSKTELKEISVKLLDRFFSDDYKKDPYLKNINKIKKANINQRDELNNILIDKLNRQDFSDIYMADFEILDFENFFSYQFKNNKFSDLSIENLNLGNNLTLEELKTLKIEVLKTEDDPHPIKWSLYKCLVFDHNNTFLSKGTVYEVKQDFLDDVDQFLETYKTLNLLQNALSTETEGQYNERMCKDNNQLVLLDKKCPNIEGYNRIEICDIYNKSNNQFIHIKRAESSSTLSHLWNQGIVSEELANSKNPRYLEKFQEETQTNFPEKHQICYGIIKKTEQLPIFSRISLYHNIKILKGMGKGDNNIKYFYIGIDNVEKTDKLEPEKIKN